MQLHRFIDTNTLNQHFAVQIATLLSQAITNRGHAYLVVSGGSTPKILFNMLSKMPLAWSNVTITLTDERWLAPAENNSNEGMVRANLLQNEAANANFVSLYCEKKTALASKVVIEKRMKNLPTFDVVILGMGEDGHTASLFPCSAEVMEGLSDSSASVIPVTPSTAAYQRMSLTKTRLLNTRTIFLHLVGEKKMTVLNQALAASDPYIMPIRAFLHHPASNVQVMFAASEV